MQLKLNPIVQSLVLNHFHVARMRAERQPVQRVQRFLVLRHLRNRRNRRGGRRLRLLFRADSDGKKDQPDRNNQSYAAPHTFNNARDAA